MARSKGLTFYKRRKKINSAIVREVFSWVFGISTAVFVAFVATYFLGMTTRVVGDSMQSTLENGQTVFINRFLYQFTSPKRGDVVVFLPNGNENAHYYVKRVLGVPGDKILITDGNLFVNGEAYEGFAEKILEPGIAANEFVLESGEYFCVGDNPNNSEDSRSANVGPVKEEDMVGKAWFHMSSAHNGIGLVK